MRHAQTFRGSLPLFMRGPRGVGPVSRTAVMAMPLLAVRAYGQPPAGSQRASAPTSLHPQLALWELELKLLRLQVSMQTLNILSAAAAAAR